MIIFNGGAGFHSCTYFICFIVFLKVVCHLQYFHSHDVYSEDLGLSATKMVIMETSGEYDSASQHLKMEEES